MDNVEEVEMYDEDEDTQKDKYMTFKLDEEFYALEIKYVDEIIGMQAITIVPESEYYIKGLINLRGKIVPVIDVRLRFGKEEIQYNDRTCIIVITIESIVVGLIVDKIAEVMTIRKEHISEPPSVGNDDDMIDNKFVYGIGRSDGEVMLLLNPRKLITDGNMELFREADV